MKLFVTLFGYHDSHLNRTLWSAGDYSICNDYSEKYRTTGAQACYQLFLVSCPKHTDTRINTQTNVRLWKHKPCWRKLSKLHLFMRSQISLSVGCCYHWMLIIFVWLLLVISYTYVILSITNGTRSTKLYWCLNWTLPTRMFLYPDHVDVWYYLYFDNDNDNDNENNLLPKLYREKHVTNTIHMILSYV